MNLPTAVHRAGLLVFGIAQTTLASSEPRKNEPVSLSPFVVNVAASDIGRYASLESISAGRVRTNIMDSSQSVSVITSELIQDVAAGRILEAAKYISGVSESTLPTSWERTSVRGFLADGRTVDGFTYSSYVNGCSCSGSISLVISDGCEQSNAAKHDRRHQLNQNESPCASRRALSKSQDCECNDAA